MIAVVPKPAASRLLPDAATLGSIAIRAGIAILVGFLVQRMLFLLVGRIERWIMRIGTHNEQARRRATTIGEMLRNLCTMLIGAAVVVRLLDLFGWDVKPLLAGAGIVGVALGFGAQSLVRDVIAGVFIIAEDQFGVGDVIDVNGQVGTVEALTVRVTSLRDENGYRIYIPNGEMKTVINRSREWNRVAVDVPLAANQDLQKALEVCRRVAATMSADPAWKPRLLGNVEVLGVESMGRDEASIRIVVRTAPGHQTQDAARELRSRLYDGLVEAGVRGGPPHAGGAVPVTAAPTAAPHTTAPPPTQTSASVPAATTSS